jgi:Right handed beta helix region
MVATLEALTTPSPRRSERPIRSRSFGLAVAGVSALVVVSVAVSARPSTLTRVAPSSIGQAAAAVAQRLASAGAVKPGPIDPPREGGAGAPPFRAGPTDVTIPAGAVRVDVDQSIDAAVRAAHDGDTVVIAPGVHRGAFDVRVPDGVTVVGEPGAVMNGSRLLEGFAPREGRWEVGGLPTDAVHDSNARCDRAHPMCGYSEDLYVDDVPQRRVASMAQVRGATWFYDYAHGTVVTGSDPAGHRVELSEADKTAFRADIGVGPQGVGVVIRNLTIEKYANRPQACAVMAQDSGGAYWNVDDLENGHHGGWTIQDNDIRLNHGCAVQAGPGSRVIGNLMHDNGQTGVKATGRHVEMRQNEIAGNNYAGFDTSWEAGGSKFWKATDLVFAENWSHDNMGGGVWSDYSLHDIVYDHNTFTGNKAEGITQEMTLSGKATNNFLAGNDWYGRGDANAVSGAIFVFDGSDFEVTGNVMRGNNGGVVVQSQERGCISSTIDMERGQCPPGSTLATVRGVWVHDNDIAMTDGFSGLVVLLHNDWPPYRYASLEWVRQQYEGMLVRFDRNTYRGTGFEDVRGKDRAFSDSSRRFLWGFPYGITSDPNDPWSWVDRRYLGFGDWRRATGQDANSTYARA